MPRWRDEEPQMTRNLAECEPDSGASGEGIIGLGEDEKIAICTIDTCVCICPTHLPRRTGAAGRESTLRVYFGIKLTSWTEFWRHRR